MFEPRGIPAARAAATTQPDPPVAPRPSGSIDVRGTAQRALVTGASGFIGRHLVRRLLADGWDVAVTVRSTSRMPQDLLGRCAVVDAEAAFEEFVAAVSSFRPTTCFHLATTFSGGRDSADIDQMVESNIAFGTRVLEALSRSGGVTVVNVGSRMQHYLGEQNRPASLYAATKQCFLDLLRYYADSQQMPVVTVELTDTYGPDDPRPKLLALLQQAIRSGHDLLMSPGDQLIEILHVDDAVNALLKAQVSATMAAPVYTAGGTTLALRAFVGEVEQALGHRVPVHWGARPYRDREMLSSWVHWPALPDWAPVVSLRDGLTATLADSARLLSKRLSPLGR